MKETEKYRQYIKRLMSKHGLNPSPSNLTPTDRRMIGTYWELMFCRLAFQQEKQFTPQQIGLGGAAQWFDGRGNDRNACLLPDVVVWTFPGEHHEIKHKNPFVMDQYGPVFGLEEYRLSALLDFQEVTHQDVLYTIHNYDLADGNLGMRNNIKHWITASVTELNGAWVYRQERGVTLYNGEYEAKPILYWPIDLWQPLSKYWNGMQIDPVIEWAKEVGAIVTKRGGPKCQS